MTKNTNKIKQKPFIKFETEVFDQIFLRDFNLSEIKILLAIVRLSAGCSYGKQKFYAEIENDVDLSFTGINKSNLGEHLKKLKEDNIIIHDDKNKLYGVNTNCALWKRELNNPLTNKIIKGKQVEREDLLRKLTKSNFDNPHKFYDSNKNFHISTVKHIASIGLLEKYIGSVSKKLLDETLAVYINQYNKDSVPNYYFVGIKNKIDINFVKDLYKKLDSNKQTQLNKTIHKIDVKLILDNLNMTDNEIQHQISEEYIPFFNPDKSKCFKALNKQEKKNF